jgi:hypothetical protein
MALADQEVKQAIDGQMNERDLITKLIGESADGRANVPALSCAGECMNVV